MDTKNYQHFLRDQIAALQAQVSTLQGQVTALTGDTGWTTITTFTNSWTALLPVMWRRFGNIAYLLGAVGSGTAGTTAFTLPAGVRPVQQSQNFWPVISSALTLNRVEIDSSTGAVTILNAATARLEQISFPVV